MLIRSLFIVLSLLVISAFQADRSGTDSHSISFLEVDLVCGAASDIGCGSRSKPILIDLENQPEIAEAWLNRPGTIIAVVWAEGKEVNENILNHILKNHKKPGRVLTQNEYTAQNSKFNSEKWYRTDEVDELSIEEAGRIAEMVVSAIKDQGSLDDANAMLMEAEVEAFIKNELLSLEDVNLLDKRSYYKSWELGIKDIARSYMDQSEVDKIHLFVMSPWVKYSFYGGVMVFLIIVIYLTIKWRSRNTIKEQEL